MSIEIMKYRGKITNWVESFKKWYPWIDVVSDPKGDYYAELESEEAAEDVEKINSLVIKFLQGERV